MMPETETNLEAQLQALPGAPGVYLFKDATGDVIYIGKAINLRARVRSYWKDTSWFERPKLAVMVPKVVAVETIVTNSEKEALLLEHTLIHQHMPRYNVAFKDDKRYPWLAITYFESFPRLIMVRDPRKFRKEHPQARMFGPYVETAMMWQTVKTLRKVFPMRQRRKPLFKDRPCMNFHIGLCLGPCQKLVAEDIYNKMVAQVELFLSGRQREVISNLRKDMEQASGELRFEDAARLRDRLQALETVVERQQVMFEDATINHDVIAEAHTEKLIVICMLRVREGKLISSETIELPLTDKTSYDEAYASFIDEYYAECQAVSIPRDVLLQNPVEDRNALSELLSQRAGHKVRVATPQRGDKTKVIEMAQKNAMQALENKLFADAELNAQAQALLTQVKEDLRLKNLPRRIECFDISHIQGAEIVASMVVCEDGQTKKSDYRHYKVQTVSGQSDDFKSMKEIVGRRYLRVVSDGGALPDLVIIDGGKGQLNAALEALAEIEEKTGSQVIDAIDIMGLAKKQEEIYKPGESQPILLPRRCQTLYLLQRVRDEAHRFAITFHRKLRAKRSLTSELDNLPGIGAARRKLLLDHFGSVSSLKEASADEIAAVPGLGASMAAKIFAKLHES